MKLEKITDGSADPPRRWYADSCAAAHGLDLLGERWSLLVMRELMFVPRRFGELRARLPGISANILTQRLAGLESAGVVARRVLPPPASAQVYALTEWGREAEPIFQTLGRWAARSPLHDVTLAFSEASFLLSMRTMLDPVRAAGLAAVIGFRLLPEVYHAVLAEGRLEVGVGEAAAPDLVFEARPPLMAAALYGGQDLSALEAAGLLRLEGDRALAERFVTVFPMPLKAVVAVGDPLAGGPRQPGRKG